MKKQENKYGLSRRIPEDVKQKIRADCGFGCVICGLGIYEYEHVDPEFNDAKVHDPSKMTLLCSQHHSKVTRKMLSKETVKDAMLRPCALQKGFASETFDISPQESITITIGNNNFEDVGALIVIADMPILQIRPPDVSGSQFLLSAKFFSSKNQISLQIIDNEWMVSSGIWDVKTEGNTITIREVKGKIHLQLIAVPPHALIISRINMFFKGFLISGDDKKISFRRPSGKERLIVGGNSFAHLPVAINIE